MVMSNGYPRKTKGRRSTKSGDLDIPRGEIGPGTLAPSNTGNSWPLDDFGGGKVKDRGIIGGAEWKNR